MFVSVNFQKIADIILNKFKKFSKTKKFKFLLGTILGYNLIFNTISGNIILGNILKSVFQTEAVAKFTKFSLLYGFIIEDLSIQAGDIFKGENLVNCKRIALEYNLPALFLFRLKLNEVSISGLNLNLHKKEKKWNFETIFPKNSEKENNLEEKKEVNDVQKDGIDTYIPVSAYLKFFLKDISIKVHIEEESVLQAGLENFNLNLEVDTHRFNKIPFSVDALNILDIFYFSINPNNNPKILFKDKTTDLYSDFNMLINLMYDSSKEKKIFSSNLKIGNENLNLSFEDKKVENFGFILDYDLSYSPEQDTLNLQHLSLNVMKSNWLSVMGFIQKISTDERGLELSIKDSEILLEELKELASKFPGLGLMDIRGKISLNGMGAKGKLSSLLSNISIKGEDIFIAIGGLSHSIPDLIIDLNSELNLNNTKISSDENILPILSYLKINSIRMNYNGIKLNLDGEIFPASKVNCNLSITDIFPEKFTKSVKGKIDLAISITGNKLSLIDLATKINISNFRYFLGNSISGRNLIDIQFLTRIDLGSGFKFEKSNLYNFLLSLKNENRENALEIKTNLELDMRGGLKTEIPSLELQTDITKLIPTLPLSIRSTIAGLRESLGNILKLNGKITYIDTNKMKIIKSVLGASLPGIELKDMKLETDLKLINDTENTIILEKLSFSGYENKLKGNYKAKFYKPFTANAPYGDYTGEVLGNFTLESPNYRYLTKGIYFKGDIDLDLDLKGAMINGKVRSNDSSFKLTSNCPGNDCNETEISGLKMNIPFSHDLNDKTMENLLGGNSENFVQNYGLTKSSNFSVDRITSNHPIEKGKKLDFVNSTPNLPGISAFLEYKENFLTLDNLRINTLNGVIFGKDFMVNVGSGNPEKIQYSATLQIRDIDLKQILPGTSKKKITDGTIKGDLNIKGENLTDPVGNIDLFFSIFQIGEDFGRSAVNIVSPTNFVTDRIINSYSVNKIEVEINHGLVYARVLFNKSVMNSLLFQVENDRIQQERIPLANFLKRAESELSEYK